MLKDPSKKYRPFASIDLPARQWPTRQLSEVPVWCSTDLRDGNQALFEPMSRETKKRLFKTLVGVGLKEIEVGFPSASETDFQTVRDLIEQKLVPDDVTLMVITQAREELIRRTIESLRGARRAIVHVYNATAPVWRRVVFGMSVPEVMQLISKQVGLIKTVTDAQPETEWVLEYSPETFSMTELAVALDACNAATRAWDAGPGRPIIINLPTTVENATPNIFADQIEWMSTRLERREHVVLSVHTHNDRGTGVAAAELGMLAGAQRVEGCLFGNGERSGNVDLVTLALNFYSQGIHPGLDFSDINSVARAVEEATRLPIHPRHPYVGDLVFTAFSGSHQDAINKGFKAMKASNKPLWEVPYLPIDPMDLGRSYEAVVRINSQSGKGGVAYIMESEHGIELPRRLQIEFSKVVQAIADGEGVELSAERLWRSFESEYLEGNGRFSFIEHKAKSDHGDQEMTARISDDGKHKTIHGHGNGPVDGFVDAMRKESGLAFDVSDYREHAMGHGANAAAIAYVELRLADGSTLFGVGIDKNIVVASLKAVVSGVNRALKRL
jgi:2-isopropylmalate synthase